MSKNNNNNTREYNQDLIRRFSITIASNAEENWEDSGSTNRVYDDTVIFQRTSKLISWKKKSFLKDL
jgi:hypothetical protein